MFATQFTSITYWTIVTQKTQPEQPQLQLLHDDEQVKLKGFPGETPHLKVCVHSVRGTFTKTPSICSCSFSSSYLLQVSVYHLQRNLGNLPRFSPSLSEVGFLQFYLQICPIIAPSASPSLLLLQFRFSSSYAWIITIKPV